MITITKREECCGCSACQQICPKECITLELDKEGFWYPKTDNNSCIDCHLCEKACPVINQETERIPIKTLAAYNRNEEIRAKSSSGGIFTLIAEEIIKRDGVVFGVKFDSNWDVIFDYATDINDLDKFRGSKYVQARLDNTYQNVLSFLTMGKEVLFTGTPCQIAGLRRFLNKDYDNLLLMDIICEGVPSPKVWKKYLKEEVSKQYEQFGKKKRKAPEDITIKDLTFRNKTCGWKQFGLTFSTIEKNNIEKDFSVLRDSSYLQALFHYVILRPICYECPFKKCKSHSDITIADYWGIDLLHPEMDDNKGTSMVYLNTKKGIEIFPTDKTIYLETNYEEAFFFNNIVTSVKRHSKRDYFYSQIDNSESIIRLLNKCTFPLSYQIIETSKKVLSKILSRKTYKFFERIWRKVRK